VDLQRATLPDLISEYTSATKEARNLGFLMRDTDLQLQQVDVLTNTKRRFRGFKEGAKRAKDEEAANIIFHMQCGLNAMISFLTMWTELKRGDHHSAWDKLIDAQEYVSIALRAAEGSIGLEDFLEHLVQVERLIFPPFPVYHSVGQIIRGGKCTVCEKPFNGCEHVEGRVYWGTLCARAQAEIVEVDHIAMVDEPRDRRCIITEISKEDGYYHDYMTGKKTRKAEEKEEGTAGRLTGIIFRFRSLEIT
jgi:hypothetical protein